jgi:hypothetical protein
MGTHREPRSSQDRFDGSEQTVRIRAVHVKCAASRTELVAIELASALSRDCRRKFVRQRMDRLSLSFSTKSGVRELQINEDGMLGQSGMRTIA